MNTFQSQLPSHALVSSAAWMSHPEAEIDRTDLAVVRVTLGIAINANGEDHDVLVEHIHDTVSSAISPLLQRDSLVASFGSQIQSLHCDAVAIPQNSLSITEEQLKDWFTDMIDSGNLWGDAIPAMLARYALADPLQMREELAERMGLD